MMVFENWWEGTESVLQKTNKQTTKPKQTPNYLDSIEEGDEEAKGTVIIGYSTTTSIGDEETICLEEILMGSFTSF